MTWGFHCYQTGQTQTQIDAPHSLRRSNIEEDNMLVSYIHAEETVKTSELAPK